MYIHTQINIFSIYSRVLYIVKSLATTNISHFVARKKVVGTIEKERLVGLKLLYITYITSFWIW